MMGFQITDLARSNARQLIFRGKDGLIYYRWYDDDWSDWYQFQGTLVQ